MEGTYYPVYPAFNRPSWMQLLQRMSEIWHSQHTEVMVQSEQMIKHLRNASQNLSKASATQWDDNTSRKIADSLLKQADKQKGGFGDAPKFPGTMAISFLLEHYHFTGYEPALKHALHSLDSMIAGGIYDQVGGGFSRYATDRDWLIPHFEKMLYDNALLISALCDAYSITKETKYKDIIEEAIAFTERELKDRNGGYYCALDADSEGSEGKYYTWTWEEWEAIVGIGNQVAAAYFGVTKEGNWEGTNILHVAKSIDEISLEYSVSTAYVKQEIALAKSSLFSARQKRIRPLTDDKSLLSWNALMNMSLSKAGVVLGEYKYILLAEAHMEWMDTQFTKAGMLQRTWQKGIVRIPAKLDDYAYLSQAMLLLASASGTNKWILKASSLNETIVCGFSCEETFFYYTSASQNDIPVRKVDLYDGATPSANAVMAYNLWICGMCMEKDEWMQRSSRMLQNISDNVVRYSYSFGYWALLLQRHIAGVKTVICAGLFAGNESKLLQKQYNPDIYVLTLEKEISELPIFEKKVFADKLHIFVCTQQACLSPVNSVGEAISLLKKIKKY